MGSPRTLTLAGVLGCWGAAGPRPHLEPFSPPTLIPQPVATNVSRGAPAPILLLSGCYWGNWPWPANWEPHPALLCHLLSPLQAQPLEVDLDGADHLALTSRSPHPCDLSQGHAFCFVGCDEATVSLPVGSCFPGYLLGSGVVFPPPDTSFLPHPPSPSILDLWISWHCGVGRLEGTESKQQGRLLGLRRAIFKLGWGAGRKMASSRVPVPFSRTCPLSRLDSGKVGQPGGGGSLP